MLTFIAVVKGLWQTAGTDGDESGGIVSKDQMEVDQILQFFEKEWDDNDGLRWTVDAQEVSEIDELRTEYYNKVDKIRHVNDRIAALVDELKTVGQLKAKELPNGTQRSIRIAELKVDISELMNKRRRTEKLRQHLAKIVAPLVAKVKLQQLSAKQHNEVPTMTPMKKTAPHAQSSTSTASTLGVRRRRRYTDSELKAVMKQY